MPKKGYRYGKCKKNTKPRGIHSRKLTEPLNSSSSTVADLNEPAVTAVMTETTDPLNSSRAEQKFTVYSNATEEIVDNNSYTIVHQSFLQSLISAVGCANCSGNSLQLFTKKTNGMAAHVQIYCPDCMSEWSAWTSPQVNEQFDINYRTIIGCNDNGIGYAKLHSLLSIMNIQAQMHHKTYYRLSKTISTAAKEAAEDAMYQAARVVCERAKAADPQPDQAKSQTGCPIITVSYDGTWQKRGHSSHNGVGVAIDVDSGLVLDTQVISNYCKMCAVGPKPGSLEYLTWMETHKPKCQKNEDCSSNAMETVAARMIFSRSVEKRKLIYGTMLCDGDAKAFNEVQKCYDIEVIKEDCINHIAKRMFNALENLKKSNKQTLNRKLTKPAIEKITNTYAKNLKDNAPDVSKMKQGVLGGFFHMMSTDKAPNHRLCPEGENSWCHYQRALKTGVHQKHRPTFSSQVGSIIYPIIVRLTESSLLQRCAKMGTQNANESFNALIWQRCPKTVFSSMAAVETATSLATLAFNCGPVGLKMVMDNIGLKWGHLDNTFSTRMLKSKCNTSRKRTQGISKWKRKNLKKRRIEREHLNEVKEGETYVPGAFNN